eukprot:m51a1_g8908 hypothetical protein (419) ;mRNA; r:765488-766815
MTTIDIKLNGTHVFVAGSPRTVSGTVLLHLSSPLAGAAVKTYLVGASAFEYVACRDLVSDSGVFLSRQCLWEPADRTASGDCAVKFDLGAIDGKQPTSHEQSTSLTRQYGGHVRYHVEVHLVGSGGVDVRRYAPISVVSLASPADRCLLECGRAYRLLSVLFFPKTDPLREGNMTLLEPATSEASKAFGFPYLTSGRIDVSLSVPRRAYGYGEVIAATVHVRNSSSTPVRDIEVRVCQTTASNRQIKWSHVLAAVLTGCSVEPGKEADVLVHLRAPVAATAMLTMNTKAMVGVYNTLDVAVRYKGLGQRLATSIVIDLSSVPRGAEAGEWSQERMAELVETTRPCIPWKVYDSESDMLKGPHVQALCVPVDRAFASQRPLNGQTLVPEGEPLCDEPCFVAVDTNTPLYSIDELGIRYF